MAAAVRIGPAPPGQAAASALAALHARAFDRPWSAQDIEQTRGDPGALLIQADPGPCGFILLRVVLDEAEVLAVAVEPCGRRAGVGAALLAAALDRAAAEGARAVWLEVAEDNLPARRLYARAGFEESGRRRGYYPRPQGAAVDALVLRRGLTGAEQTPIMAGAGSARVYGIEQACIDKGLRMTGQRRVIARVLSEAHDHPDVEELHRRAASIDPHISIATVYRTVRLFEEAGIVARHDFRDGRSRYEELPDHHHDHLIDMKTGQVVEFVDEEIERLQSLIARRLGYRLVDHRLELYGIPVGESET